MRTAISYDVPAGSGIVDTTARRIPAKSELSDIDDVAANRGVVMRHIHQTIGELRRYIAASDKREELEEIDALLAVALTELRRKLRQDPQG